MTNKKIRRRIAFAIAAMLILFFFGGYSFYRFSTNVSPSDLALRKKLVGTWIADTDDAVDFVFLADGTGWSMAKNHDPTRNSNFDWTTNANELRFYPRIRDNRIRRLRIMIAKYLGEETSMKAEIVDISDDQLEIHDRPHNTRFTFKRATDAP